MVLVCRCNKWRMPKRMEVLVRAEVAIYSIEGDREGEVKLKVVSGGGVLQEEGVWRAKLQKTVSISRPKFWAKKQTATALVVECNWLAR